MSLWPHFLAHPVEVGIKSVGRVHLHAQTDEHAENATPPAAHATTEGIKGDTQL